MHVSSRESEGVPCALAGGHTSRKIGGFCRFGKPSRCQILERVLGARFLNRQVRAQCGDGREIDAGQSERLETRQKLIDFGDSKRQGIERSTFPFHNTLGRMTVLQLFLVGGVAAYIYNQDKSSETNSLKFDGEYMFGSDTWKGSAYVAAKGTCTVHTKASRGYVLVKLGGTPECTDDDSPDADSRRFQLNSTAVDVLAAKVDFKVDVSESGQKMVGVAACNGVLNMHVDEVKFKGTLTFKNPTGYLPAPLVGYLPFELCLMIVYCLAWLAHSFQCVRRGFRFIHFLAGCALFAGAASAACWFAAYVYANDDGSPLDDPYLAVTIVATIAEICARLASRILVLAAAQAVGTGTGMRTGFACFMIVLWAAAYIAVSALTLFAKIEFASDDDNYFKDHDQELYLKQLVTFRVPELFFEFTCFAWAFRSCAASVDFFTTTGQSAEADKARALKRVVSTSVFLVAVYSFFVFVADLVDTSKFRWPYAFGWAKTVHLDILTLGLVLCVAINWQPSDPVSVVSQDRMVIENEEDDGGSFFERKRDDVVQDDDSAGRFTMHPAAAHKRGSNKAKPQAKEYRGIATSLDDDGFFRNDDDEDDIELAAMQGD